MDLTGGELTVQAGEAATFTATTESEAHASGGSQFGGGTVIAERYYRNKQFVERCRSVDR